MSNAFDPPMLSNPEAIPGDGEIRSVSINPFVYLVRGKSLLGDDYWLFVLISFVAFFLGTIVPFNILMGPMLVGVYMCMAAKERGERLEVGMVFNGFDRFVDALLVFLILAVANIIIFVPIAFGLIVGFASAEASGNQALTAILAIGSIPLVIIIAVLTYFPVMFAYQLIADRGTTAPNTIKLSFRGAWKNALGVVIYMLVAGFLSFIATALCIVPFFLFLPISLAGLFVYYRDVFGLLSSEMSPYRS
jgi:hypothetical protein